MKTLISIAWFVGFICSTSFAQEQIKVLSHETNDDGSITFYRPYIKNSQGDISGESHRRALCQRLNMAEEIAWTPIKSRRGKIEKHDDTWIYGSDGSIQPLKHDSPVIEFLVCSPSSRFLPLQNSTHYQDRIENAKARTVKIVQPTFGSFHGKLLPISYSMSHFDGVCKLYGFEHAAPNPMIEKDEGAEMSTMISSEGSFRGFSLNSSETIKSIVCVRPLEYTLGALGVDLEQFPYSLNKIGKAVYPVWASILKDSAEYLQKQFPIEPIKYVGNNLRPGNFTDAHWARVASFFFLEGLMNAQDSVWFEREVAPLYAERKEWLKAFSGIRSMSDLHDQTLSQKGFLDANAAFHLQAIFIQVAMNQIASTAAAMKSNESDPEKLKWLDSIYNESLAYISADPSHQKLDQWINVWMKGSGHRATWASSQRLTEVNQLFQDVGVWILRCK